MDYSSSSYGATTSSNEIFEFLKNCGIDAKYEGIPRWMFDYPAGTLSHLYRGLMDGTGSQREGVFHTTSPELATGFVELCVKLGKMCSIELKPAGSKLTTLQGKMVCSRPCYEVRTVRETMSRWFENRDARYVDYSGKVWCPSVPGTNNLLVERNGKFAFSGNTKYGDGGVDVLPIAHLYKTQVRELGRKLGVPESIVTKPSSPNLWKGQKATDEIPIEYETLDRILKLLYDSGLPPLAVSRETGVSNSVIDKVIKMNRASQHKRSYPPMVVGW